MKHHSLVSMILRLHCWTSSAHKYHLAPTPWNAIR